VRGVREAHSHQDSRNTQTGPPDRLQMLEHEVKLQNLTKQLQRKDKELRMKDKELERQSAEYKATEGTHDAKG